MGLADIKARLEAARGLAWHSYKLARYKDGRVDYAVAPSPLERTHFSEGEAEFVVCSREDMAKLLAVIDSQILGRYSPEAHAEQCGVEMMNSANEQEYDEWKRARDAWAALT